MGIPMEDHNIHAPTVASGPTSGAAPRDLSKLSMVELMQEKDRIEEELKELSQVLSTVWLFYLRCAASLFLNRALTLLLYSTR